ncbi:MAG: FRG domain-containing protein [Reyranella sp.]|uniref:FRG domain-containing protein n=1 Tax=Reyranella sp. TaxID=1929291 RepID=UPI001AC6B286|nr:FRG domain-containing protein [Reyranella sp.]MBN9086373.1 FRG domain-containing protein [Reyranella sp.]
MKGQWIGDYRGGADGRMIVNVDELPTCFEGMAYLHPHNGRFPRAEAHFTTAGKNSPFSFRTTWLQPLHPDNGNPVAWATIKDRFPADVAFSTYVDVNGTFTKDELTLNWKSDVGADGSCVLPRSKASDVSFLQADQPTWEEFKAQAIEFGRKGYIMRGQSKAWRLRTAFHRTGRANLAKFLGHDIPALHQHLSARTKHYFQLTDPLQNAAFLSLAQHHGYPTNLLDWTKSPYVAAFFAYRTVSRSDLEKATEESRVRIHVFDLPSWRRLVQQVAAVASPIMHVSLVDVLAIENERLIPQQAVALISSVDDIESYIRTHEEAVTRTFLRAIDLPMLDRAKVMEELRFMGITAGSLFPGLDGACEELKERNFQ